MVYEEIQAVARLAARASLAVAIVLFPAFGIEGCRQADASSKEDRAVQPAEAQPDTPAQINGLPLIDDDTGPVQVADVPGLPRFGRVTRWLYRGGEPTAEGLARLKEMGVRTVIDLRGTLDNREAVEAAGMHYLRVPMFAWNPTDEAVIKFLQAATYRDRGPYYVHCWLGTERTAFMSAMYRMVFCGWDKESAIREMLDNDYNGFLNQQQPFAEGVDVAELRRLAGVPDTLVRRESQKR